MTDRDKMDHWFDWLGVVDNVEVKRMPSSVRVGKVRYSFNTDGELTRVQEIRSVAGGKVLYRTVAEA
jgi:hypothetical protein